MLRSPELENVLTGHSKSTWINCDTHTILDTNSVEVIKCKKSRPRNAAVKWSRLSVTLSHERKTFYRSHHPKKGLLFLTLFYLGLTTENKIKLSVYIPNFFMRLNLSRLSFFLLCLLFIKFIWYSWPLADFSHRGCTKIQRLKGVSMGEKANNRNFNFISGCWIKDRCYLRIARNFP